MKSSKVIFQISVAYWKRIHAEAILQKPVSVSNDGVCPLNDCVVATCAKDGPKPTDTSSGDDVIYVISFGP